VARFGVGAFWGYTFAAMMYYLGATGQCGRVLQRDTLRAGLWSFLGFGVLVGGTLTMLGGSASPIARALGALGGLSLGTYSYAYLSVAAELEGEFNLCLLLLVMLSALMITSNLQALIESLREITGSAGSRAARTAHEQKPYADRAGEGAPPGQPSASRESIAARHGPGHCAECARDMSRYYPSDEVYVIQKGGAPLREPPGIRLGVTEQHLVYQHVFAVDSRGYVWDNFSVAGSHGLKADYLAAIQAANGYVVEVSRFPSFEAAAGLIYEFAADVGVTD
jgi:hypothetical protein